MEVLARCTLLATFESSLGVIQPSVICKLDIVAFGKFKPLSGGTQRYSTGRLFPTDGGHQIKRVLRST